MALDCKEMLGDSLILMGDIGANDYVYMFFQGKSINEVEELVPLVIKAISSAIVVISVNSSQHTRIKR